MEAIDLTLPKLFAGDRDPSLLFQDHRAAREAVRSNRNILAHGDWRRVRVFADPDLFVMMADSNIIGERDWGLVDDCLGVYRKVFDRHHPLHGEIDPWVEMFSGEGCDCCGTRLTVMNRAACGSLCDKCDDRPSQSLLDRLFGGRSA